MKLLLGQHHTVNLTAQSGAGYRWEIAKDSDNEGVGIEESIVPYDAGDVGGSSSQIFILRAIKEGSYKIRFQHKRFWENEPIESHELEVEVTSTIHFYSSRGEHGYMSNFARYEVEVDGKKYPTSEHRYQSQKFAHTMYENKVREANGPMDAADMGRRRDFPLRADWESVRDDVMREVVEAKFRQHPELARQLIETCDARLVEHTSNDSYWADGGDGSGKNMLGVILMEVRSKLRI